MSEPVSVIPHTSSTRMYRRCSDSGCLVRRDDVSSSPTHTRQRPMRRCSFGSVSVREHEQTLGDNPSCQEGAPISLGWKVIVEKSSTLDDYEKVRKDQRRRRSELVLSSAERRKLLVMNGSTTLMDVLHAERLVALKNGMVGLLPKNMKPSKSKAAPKKALTSRAA